ncbi:hypothetical protein DMC18_13950 [Caulobacter sp. D5]|nr:hypothetical protein DMC18_13950 [Caulobacter sp. D5]
MHLFRMLRFVKAVLAGALAGAMIPLCVTLPLAVAALFAPGAPAEAVLLGVLPLLASLAVVLPASLVIGLPVCWLLRRRGAESAQAYLCWGGGFGLLLPLALVIAKGASEAILLCGPGVIAGAATGYVWWRGGAKRAADA